MTPGERAFKDVLVLTLVVAVLAAAGGLLNVVAGVMS